MTTKAIEAGARAFKQLVTEDIVNRTERPSYTDVAKVVIEAALASGELVPASAVAAERERCAKAALLAIRQYKGAQEQAHSDGDEGEGYKASGSFFSTDGNLSSFVAAAIRALSPEPASGEYVLVPREILTDAMEALEQTDDWHVAGSENWTLRHQIDTLLHPETIGLNATKDGERA